jgi:hypothetical protein
MKRFNLLFDSEIEGDKETIFNSLEVQKIEEIQMVDINGVQIDESQNYYSFNITGRYMETFTSLPISFKVQTLMKLYPNVFTVILSEHESDNENAIKLLEINCEKESINSHQIIIINGNQKIKQLIDDSNSRIIGHTSNRLPYVAVEGMNSFKYEFNPEKESFFMCYNRMIKSHRLSLLILLKREGILDEIDWTLLRANEIKKHFTNHDGSPSFNLVNGVLDRVDFENYKNEVSYFYELECKNSKYETEYKIDEPPYFIDFYKTYEMNPYKNSYVNIVTETNYISTDVVHITEKSLIPIYYSQIPLILANFEHNKFLRTRYDLDLFEDIIDYSYDNEKNPKKRLFMFVNEIKRLNLIKEEVILFYKKNQERFENNKKKIINILQDDTDYNFFKSLI